MSLRAFGLLLVVSVAALGCDDAADDGGKRVTGTEGRERWVVTFEGEASGLDAYRKLLVDEPARVAAFEAEQRKALTDKRQSFDSAVQAVGGRIVETWWMHNACTIEVPAGVIASVKVAPGVKDVKPDALLDEL
jgi:hypothetical protein